MNVHILICSLNIKWGNNSNAVKLFLRQFWKNSTNRLMGENVLKRAHLKKVLCFVILCLNQHSLYQNNILYKFCIIYHFSPLNHIWSVTFFSNFDTFWNMRILQTKLAEGRCSARIIPYLPILPCNIWLFYASTFVPSSRVKQDNGGSYHSMLHKVSKDHISHCVVYYTFPAQPVLFLMENQHCSK